MVSNSYRGVHILSSIALFVASLSLPDVMGYPTSTSDASNAMASTASGKKTVMVTGANGFLASHIVQDLLASGHTVHACVRDAAQESTVAHLLGLHGAKERLNLFSTGDLADANSKTKPFDAPMKGCHAVIHSATPLSVKFGSHSGHDDIYVPAMTSTQELLDCLARHSQTVTCLVLTSSMSAMAPNPEPAVKDESHWSDAQSQRERDNWYGCTKTSQELLVRDFVRKAKKAGKLSSEFCYAAICPTVVLGPVLKAHEDPKQDLSGTMARLQQWLKGEKSESPNDSLSFVHVQDCAKMHTRILELKADDINVEQRYMSLMESWHWNDILAELKDLYPSLPDYRAYEGDDKVQPTQFNLENVLSLKVPIRSNRETLQDSVEYLQKIGALD